MKRDTVLNLCGLWAVWMDWLCSRKLHIILLGVMDYVVGSCRVL
jgi:hypothetical protein